MNWLRNLPIRRKLTLAMLLSSTAALALTCAVYLAHERQAFRQSMELDMSALAKVIAENNAAVVMFNREAEAEKNLSVLSVEPRVVAACLYGTSNTILARYSLSNATLNLPDQPGPEGAWFTNKHLVLEQPVRRNGKIVGSFHMCVSLDRLRERLQLYGTITLLALLGSSLLTVMLSAGVQRIISNPILDLARTARGISERKDYSARADKHGTDEIGQLTDAFNQMLAEIEAGQSALHRTHQALLEQTSEMRRSVEVLGSSASKILDFSTHVATSANETATAVGQTTTTVEEVRQAAQASSEKARRVADGAQRVAQTSELGRQATEETVAGMQRIRQQMESVASSMAKLNAQSQDIGQIIATVDDLAQQSKILSVNAAIEAAKAGEQGKGFAVVAQEIKSLAEQSRQATTRVREILSDIQHAAREAVQATEQGSQAVEHGVRQSAQAGDSIVTLAHSVAEAAQATTLIAASSQQQVVGMEQVTSAMHSVKEASAQNVESARQLETAVQNLNELGQKLKRLVELHQAQEPPRA